ncbi:40S ribosomal protein S13 [Tanacetum coccineum]
MENSKRRGGGIEEDEEGADSLTGSHEPLKSVNSPTIYPINRRSCSAKLPESAKPGFKIVPWEIYCLIREALDLRKHFETKKNDEEYLLNLESAEGCIRSLAEEYKVLEELPPDWQ